VTVEKGTASGVILDAARQGNVGIENLTLEIRIGLNNITGEIVLKVYTTTNGAYTITGLDAGNYTVKIIDERELANENQRYGSTYFNIKIIDGQTISQQNGSVSNGVASGQMRIVLEWGSTPRDLDSHLTGPKTTGSSRFHVFYSHMSDDSVTLDRDDTDCYGPETTTITEYSDGVYRFSVHDYTNSDKSSSTALANSGATVKVYFGDELYVTYYVPNQAGTLWTVFEYDSTTGVIKTINTMSYQSSSSNVS
jgi:hypothetical protein